VSQEGSQCSDRGFVRRPEAGEIQAHRARQIRDDTLQFRHYVRVQAPVDHHDLTSTIPARADPERHAELRRQEGCRESRSLT
jgi:hypothetical protein